MTAYLGHFVTHHGYMTLAVAMLLEGLGLPLPAELLFIPAGFLISGRQLHLPALILAASIGGVAGNLLTYAAGRWGGRRFIERYGHFVHLKPESLDQVGEWFNRYGGKTIFVSRFVGFIRAAAMISAGIGRMPIVEFAGFQFLGALVWNTLWAVAAWRLGRRLTHLEHHIGRVATGLTVAAVVAIALFWWWRHNRNHKDKRE